MVSVVLLVTVLAPDSSRRNLFSFNSSSFSWEISYLVANSGSEAYKNRRCFYNLASTLGDQYLLHN